MIRELATKRLASPPRNHLHIDTTILSKGIPRKREIHPKISKNVDALTRKLTYAIKQKAASGTFDSVNTFLTSKKSVSDEQIDSDEFPLYSYKRYKPLPTVVYTQHEEEANDLIAGLKPGYVAFLLRYIYIHNFLVMLYTINWLKICLFYYR